VKKISPKSFYVMPLMGAVFFFFTAPISVCAQAKITSALIKPDSTDATFSPADSLNIQGAKIKPLLTVQSKSGSLAMLLSAVVPGAGQIYAHRYYTIPFIYGFGVYFSSIAIKANTQYEDYRSRFSESVRLDTAAHQGNQNLLDARDFYHDQRDEYILYLGLTYFLNIIDAYVGATLYDFDVSEDLGGSAKIQFRIPVR